MQALNNQAPAPFEQLTAARSRFDASRAAVTDGSGSSAVVAADATVAQVTTDLTEARLVAATARGTVKDTLVELHAAGQGVKDGIDAVLASHPLA